MNQTATANVPVFDTLASHRLADVIAQLESVLLGKREQVTLALACLLGRGHLLIEDVPGVGKTTLAHALSATLGLDWTRVQFTSDLLPADVVGVSILDSRDNSFVFQRGPVFTSILLADEINRAPPRAQSALLEAMEERQVTVDGVTHPLDEAFFVIATQNPTDQLGAYPLPESQLDRFLVGIEIGYPDATTERKLLELGDRRQQATQLDTLLDAESLAGLRTRCEDVHVSGPVIDYIQALIHATRTLGTGLSPRAGLNLVRLCRAYAVIAQRDHVMPEDVRAVFPALAGHRLTGQVKSGHAVATGLLDQVAMP
ncbi:MAG: AAA family ATPase [Pseudomonadota bacterium]